MAAKKGAKKSAKKGAKSKLPFVRGAPLVDLVIASLKGKKKPLPDGEPKPLLSAQIEKLSFLGGKPLPPSLRQWLEFDARYLGLFDNLKNPSLPRRTFRQMMEREFDRQTAETFDFSDMLPGDCFALPSGSDSRAFLYVGEPDALGEYPILLVDTDDVPFVCVEYPGLDVYLAITFDAITHRGRETYAGLFDDPTWASAMIDQARRNLRGFKSFDAGASDTEHVDGEEAAQEAMEAFFAKMQAPENRGDDDVFEG